MGSKSKTTDKGTKLTPEGQAQFDFAAGELRGALGRPVANVGFDGSGIQRGISDLRSFGPSKQTNQALARLGNFTGTQRAKTSLDRLGGFRGSGEAFRTLSALESFGADQAAFDSEAQDLLLSTARGDFLTEQAGNPFIADQIRIAQQGSIDQFNEQVLPNLFANFAGTGGVGSSLSAAVAAQQARDLQRNLGDISSNIAFNVFEAERGRQQGAQEALLGFDNASLERLLTSRVQAGQQATALSQQELDAIAARAQGEVSLSAQQQASLQALAGNRVALDQARGQALAGALSGETSLAEGRFNASALNAQLEAERINQLIAAQQAAAAGGEVRNVKSSRTSFFGL